MRAIPLEEPRYDVYAISMPARTFTGDFWFTHAASHRLWFALGDVAGKGLPAAIVQEKPTNAPVVQVAVWGEGLTGPLTVAEAAPEQAVFA